MTTMIQNNSFFPDWPASLQPAPATCWDKVASVAWNIFSLIIFPIALARLAYYFANRVVTWIILPSMIAYSDDLLDSLRWGLTDRDAELGMLKIGTKEFSSFYTPRLQRDRFWTPDDVWLDGMFFSGKRVDKVILYVGGNAGTYETFFVDEEAKFLQRSGASIFAFNPEYTGKSGGFPNPERLSLDVYSAYEYLFYSKGIKPEDILLYGRSMGGCYGNLGAALIQEKYPDRPIKAISRNSFDTLANAARHMVGCGPIGLIAALGIYLFRWQMDSKAAWEKLTGDKFLIYHERDRTIPLDCSLHQATEQGERYSMELSEDETINGHFARFTENDQKVILAKIRKLLQMEDKENYVVI
jgi:hypothetical protein